MVHTRVLYLEHHLRCHGSLIIGRPPLEIVLILLTIHALVNSLTQETVTLVAHRTLELVYIVLIETESCTIGSLTMEAVGGGVLCLT